MRNLRNFVALVSLLACGCNATVVAAYEGGTGGQVGGSGDGGCPDGGGHGGCACPGSVEGDGLPCDQGTDNCIVASECERVYCVCGAEGRWHCEAFALCGDGGVGR